MVSLIFKINQTNKESLARPLALTVRLKKAKTLKGCDLPNFYTALFYINFVSSIVFNDMDERHLTIRKSLLTHERSNDTLNN